MFDKQLQDVGYEKYYIIVACLCNHQNVSFTAVRFSLIVSPASSIENGKGQCGIIQVLEIEAKVGVAVTKSTNQVLEW